MGITPMEINNKEFKRSFRGYDIDEVDDFLEQVVDDYEKLYKENTALREKINSLSEKLEHYTKIEATLQNTLVLAQGAADQAKNNSQKEAELIIKNSNDTAQKIIDQAHTEVVRINGEYERIKQEFQLFKSRYKTFIQTQLDLLSDIDTLGNDTKSMAASELSSKSNDLHNVLNEYSMKLADGELSAVASEEEETAGSIEEAVELAAKLSGTSSSFDDFDDND
ncbi:septum site-determining protein DivIVA [Oxobacter pfennigii]|uniref:Septum site-determining protein DivIVA n=1 Tax=Oxobacter pfennigii TaxID=36849 RepID=A0A0P8YWA8_9CLOT|nr:DivIVA domain-containing protein [Oxobacter pfennigii]KPU43996.1 septum site-determining protein DivIVA [Oxobacter pfennigii]